MLQRDVVWHRQFPLETSGGQQETRRGLWEILFQTLFSEG